MQGIEDITGKGIGMVMEAKEGMLITAMAMVGLQADGAAAEGHGILTVVGVFTLQRLGAAMSGLGRFPRNTRCVIPTTKEATLSRKRANMVGSMKKSAVTITK